MSKSFLDTYKTITTFGRIYDTKWVGTGELFCTIGCAK